MHADCVVVSGIILVTGMMELAALMNQTIISPVVALVKAAQRIAANDFFSEDVQVQNEDELGELVHAFNKMKYATGEYIMALEEKRKTLDLLIRHTPLLSDILSQSARKNQLHI